MKKEQMEFKEWCAFNPSSIGRDTNHRKILNFYLWSCPSPETAYKAKTFKNLGWEKSHQYKYLKKSIIYSNDISFVVTTVKDLAGVLDGHNQLENHSLCETIVLVNPSNGEMDGVFRSIRNALAHGSFRIQKKSGDDYFYFFENRNPKTKNIKSRIVLKSTTLIDWIKVVEKGPKKVELRY